VLRRVSGEAPASLWRCEGEVWDAHGHSGTPLGAGAEGFVEAGSGLRGLGDLLQNTRKLLQNRRNQFK